MKTNLVHNLISSLSKNEKGYFIQHLSNSDSNYGKLFTQISSQKIYCEDVIKDNFKDTYIGNNLSFAKNYLYHAILKNLINYRANKRDDNYHLSSIKILYDKGLYYNCAKMVKQVYKLFIAKDDYLSALQIIQIAKMLSYTDLRLDLPLNDIINDEFKLIDKHKIVSVFQSLESKARTIVMKGHSRIEEDLNQLREIVNHEYLLTKDYVIDKNCERLYHDILFLCGDILYDKALIHNNITPLQQLLKDPIYEDDMNAYRKSYILVRVIHYNITISNFNDAQENIDFLYKVLSASNNINESDLLAYYSLAYNFHFDVLLKQREIKKAKDLSEKIILFINNHKGTIRKRVLILINANLFVLYFMNKDYKKALLLSNDLLTTRKDLIRMDVYNSIMLLEVVIFYELHEIDLFESRLNSFKNYLKNYEVNGDLWGLFVNFFDQILKGNEFKSLSNELMNQIDQLPNKNVAKELYFLVDWLLEKTLVK